MIRIDDILETLRGYHPGADLDLVRKAYIFSAKVHQGQTRLSGDPYMTHAMEVAYNYWFTETAFFPVWHRMRVGEGMKT